jgi:hypothetical protein
MPQYSTDITVEQGVDFLARRQVGLRYSCVPSLEKVAQNEAEGEGGGGTAGTFAALLADPSVRAALLGTGIGGGVGLLAGLRRKKERRNLLRDALTGALAGGVGLGGLSLAGRALQGQFADKVSPEAAGLPGQSIKEQNSWGKDMAPEELEAAYRTGLNTLYAEAEAREPGSGTRALADWHQGQESPADGSLILDTIGEWIGHVAGAGKGAGQLVGDVAQGAAINPLIGRRGDLDDTELGNVLGAAGAVAAPAYVGGVAANQFGGKRSAPGRVDKAVDRITSIGEANFGETAFTKPETVKFDAAGNPTSSKAPTRTAASMQLNELFNKNIVDRLKVQHPDAYRIIREGLHGGGSDAQKALQRLIMNQPEPDAGTKAGKKAFEDFLGAVHEAERAHLSNLDPKAPKTTYGNIQIPDRQLGHFAGAVQQGRIPVLRDFAGQNPHFRNPKNIPNAPKLPPTFSLPKGRGRGWGLLGTFGGGALYNYASKEQAGANLNQDAASGAVESVLDKYKK